MKNTILYLGLPAVLALASNALVARGSRAEPAAFETLSMHVEVDLPSPWLGPAPSAGLHRLPAEVVLELAAPSGLARLCVRNQAGQELVRLDAPGASLGVSELALECTGATLADALETFPPGEYLVEATTVDGNPLQGRVRLEGGFPGLFTVVSPLPGEIVPPGSATLTWTLPRGAAGYVLEVEQEELGFELEVSLAPWQTSFTVPAEMLQSGRTYEYSLAVRGDTDNELELEGTFTTAPGAFGPPLSKGF